MHFRVGAVSVSYLATVLLQLADKGRLSLDDPLSEWYPDLPRADEVTLRMLINSTSGYADYVGEGLPIYDDPFRRWTAAELIDFGLSKPAVCDPGTCFNYSHTNFVILGEVLREVTGRSVSRLIRKRVVRPLALRETQSNSTARIRRPVLHAFTSERGAYEESTFWNPSWTIGPGAVMTSDIADVARSAKAIGTGELVSRPAHREQVGPSTADVPPLSPELYYGLGVLVRNGWIVQNPSLAGYSGVMAYLPARRITIAVTSTNGPGSPEEANTQSMFTELAAYLSPGTEPPVLP
jgi:CubicO group peptidase (beta-lactamase class C family)